MEEQPTVELRLTADEALVMSDWIHRLQDQAVPLADEAVWVPLYRIGGTLETMLPEMFSPDYHERVQSARLRLLAKLGVNERLSE
jgi:hypothetical protein